MMLAAVVRFLVENVVFALMLATGLATERGALRQIARTPRLYLRALLVLELGVPLVAMAVVGLLGPPARGALVIMLMAICPGAPFIPFATKDKGQTHSAVGLNLLILASVLAPITVPAWLAVLHWFDLLDLAITPSQVAERVLPTIGFPLLLGFVIGQLWPRAAGWLRKVTHAFFLLAFAVTLGLALYLGLPVLAKVAPITFVAAAIVVAGSWLMGYLAAAPQPGARRTVGTAAVLGNPGLALAVVAAGKPGMETVALVAAYLIFRKLVLVPLDLSLALRRRARGDDRRSRPGPFSPSLRRRRRHQA